MSADDPARRIRLWSVLVVVGVFLAGAIAGAGVFAWVRPPPHKWRPHHRDLPALFTELDLTAEQSEKAKAIFEKHRATVESILKADFPRMRAADEQSNREFRSILTDVQRKKFDEIEARPRPGRHKGFGGGPPPPGAPGERGPVGELSPAAPRSTEATSDGPATSPTR